MAYLFAHFTSDKTGDKEHIWFSVSDDGLHWQDLGEAPAIVSHLGTGGIRDPFIVYDEKAEKYYIIATDLLTTSGSWDDFANRGSRSLLVWESVDLINWTDERLVEVGIPGAGCVWAPEAVYCKEKQMWFVFFASNVREEGDNEPKQRIYGTFTKDFREFTPTFKYIDAQTAVIDTDIVWDNGYYYRFSKDETNKIITIERSADLVDGKYERIHSETFDNYFGLEGPEAYFLDEKQMWCLIADRYHGNHGYTPFLSKDLSSGEFIQLSPDEYSMGERKKRHGGIIKIQQDVVELLQKHYKQTKTCKNMLQFLFNYGNIALSMILQEMIL